jgi:hypothetical protein
MLAVGVGFCIFLFSLSPGVRATNLAENQIASQRMDMSSGRGGGDGESWENGERVMSVGPGHDDDKGLRATCNNGAIAETGPLCPKSAPPGRSLTYERKQWKEYAATF